MKDFNPGDRVYWFAVNRQIFYANLVECESPETWLWKWQHLTGTVHELALHLDSDIRVGDRVLLTNDGGDSKPDEATVQLVLDSGLVLARGNDDQDLMAYPESVTIIHRPANNEQRQELLFEKEEA